MQDKQLLLDLLGSETEDDALAVLTKRGLLYDATRWRSLGNMPNNQSVVHAQQSTPSAALIEKFTNGIDAILMRRCKAAGIDPRGAHAPQSMAKAVEKFYGDLSPKTSQEIRTFAEENLVLYATGTKARPCLSFYDAGEGQLAPDFPLTFCSLIYGSEEGSYKGAVPFVQGRFNMGGTGVLPFCGDNRKIQLIVSRVPNDVVGAAHEWAFTLFCFFASKSAPSWKYLIGSDGNVLTAGSAPLGLVPKVGAKSGEVCAPREREVPHGTLIKMYDYKAPRSNICGELFKKLEDYLLKPALPLRLIECRPEYQAKVMGVTIWDRLDAWGDKKLEEGFEDGASFQVQLSTDETVTGEIRVFKASEDDDAPQTGLRVLINGQSHAKRDWHFFESKSVDKEHVAESMLVTLDCTALGQTSRNAIFMSNREHFRDDPLVTELLKKVQKELREHEGLKDLNKKRYEQKIADATKDVDGINAIEEMLLSEPALAELFGSMMPGKVAAKTVTAKGPTGTKITEKPKPFVGTEFPTYFKRANDATSVTGVELPRGSDVRISFLTDVKNNYFSRSKNRGECTFEGPIEPALHLFNGRLSFTFSVDKKLKEGTEIETKIAIADSAGHGPFHLVVKGTVAPPRPKTTHEPKKEKEHITEPAPSRPEVLEANKGPEDPPITIEKVPNTTPPRLVLQINKGSQLLIDAKKLRKKEEEAAVEFVFKYGLALVAMGLLDAAKKTPLWQSDEAVCRKNIQEHAAGVARVIVPLCLTLPQKLPTKLQKAA